MSLLGRLRSGVKKCDLPPVRATSEPGLKKDYLQPENSGLLGGTLGFFSPLLMSGWSYLFGFTAFFPGAQSAIKRILNKEL